MCDNEQDLLESQLLTREQAQHYAQQLLTQPGLPAGLQQANRDLLSLDGREISLPTRAPTQARAFNPEKHLRSFAAMPWEPMMDDHGQPLVGIRGKSGASETGYDGVEIGGDLIEMQPGSAFPLHVHPGDHVLYAIVGIGTVTIDGVVHRFEAGSTFFVAAEHPHAVGTYADASEPFVLLAVGHPQKHVADRDRMTVLHEASEDKQQSNTQ